jgi:hypothetical protein
MAPIPHARPGGTLFVKERLLPFSFFPTTRDNRRWGLYDALFAMSPWPVMEAAIRDRVTDSDLQSEALAFLEQAQDFYAAASTRVAANPLLLYYAFLNLGKSLLLALGYPDTPTTRPRAFTSTWPGSGSTRRPTDWRSGSGGTPVPKAGTKLRVEGLPRR